MVEALRFVGEAPVVVDPVMVAESGAVLLDDEARAALVERLLPLATVVTPNIPEARALTGAGERDSQEDLAREVLALGPHAVVVTGGHSERVVDLFFDGRESAEIAGERHPDGAAHGSGCTHSSALAAFLALGETPLEAARKAREIASAAVAAGLREIGRGPGPGRRLRPGLWTASVDFSHELQRRHHDQASPSPLQRRLRRPRPRPRARLHEGHRLRRRGAQPADDRHRQHLDRGDARATSTCAASPSTSKRASAPPAARRWSSTPSRSPTGSRWAPRG